MSVQNQNSKSQKLFSTRTRIPILTQKFDFHFKNVDILNFFSIKMPVTSLNMEINRMLMVIKRESRIYLTKMEQELHIEEFHRFFVDSVEEQ